MKRKLLISFLFTLLVALCAAFAACGLLGGGGSEGSGAELIKVKSAVPEGNEVYLFFENSSMYIYRDDIEVSDEASYIICYDEACTEVITGNAVTGKGGTLANGNNYFYIKVTSGDSKTENTYKLTVYRSFGVTVYYYDGDEYLTDRLAYTGVEFINDYTHDFVGYTFGGWYDGENNKFTSGVLWGDIKLYASKTPITYKATLNANGGSQPQKTEFSIDYDSDFTLPVTERYGYDFAGWYADDTKVTDGTGKAVAGWNFAKDTALTAKWTIKQYAINLQKEMSAGGSVKGGGLYDHGSTASLTAATNDGYTFMGWYDEDDELITMNATYEFQALGDRTLTVKWDLFTLSIKSETGGVVFPIYTVKFDLNGGTGTTPEAQTVAAFKGLEYPTETPTRAGYLFRGWSTETYISSVDGLYDFSAYIEGDLTLYATWYKLPETDADKIINVGRLETSIELKGKNSANNSGHLYFCPIATGNYTFEYEGYQIGVSSSDEDYSGVSFVVYNITASNPNTEVFRDSFKERNEKHTKTVRLEAGNIYRFDAWRNRDNNIQYYFGVSAASDAKPREGGGTRMNSLSSPTPTRAGTVFTVEANADPGYEFLGWYDETGALVSTELVFEIIMPYASKVYTAKWQLIS